MDSITRFFKKLRLLVRREDFHLELEEEMAFHREQAERQLQEEGMTPEAAHHKAMRQFGNATRLKEQSHETIGFWFETASQDLLFAIRQLRKNRGFACTAILVLALGICANVAIFSFV